jgi:small nuclear ribonucleoprotein (snRNP)-like protein
MKVTGTMETSDLYVNQVLSDAQALLQNPSNELDKTIAREMIANLIKHRLGEV